MVANTVYPDVKWRMANENKKELESLSAALLKLRNESEISAFLKDILTRKELNSVILRWQIAKMLHEEKLYHEIERETGASSATISKVSEFLKYGHDGYQISLDRMKKQKKG